jgi:hypothetical protein
MTGYKKLHKKINSIIKKINKTNLDKQILDAKLEKYDFHIVVIALDGVTLYDNYFKRAIPNYHDNPAYKCAIQTKKSGTFKIKYGKYKDYYLAVHNKNNVVMISTDKKSDPRNVGWQLLLNFDKGFINQDLDYIMTLFNPNALFCFPGGCRRGITAIRNHIQPYIDSGIDKDIVLPAYAYHFDPIANGGVLERTWTAINTEIDEKYEQDDAIMFRFDNDGLFTYVHEYFDPLQKIAHYSQPPVVPSKKC